MSVLKSDATRKNNFDLANGKLFVKGIPLLSEVPTNVSYETFSSVNSPLPLLHRALSNSHNGGFLGFRKQEPSDRLANSLGKFTGRNFLSIFRFKTWWCTQWVGRSGSDLQMETQWVLLDVPEISSYVLILPIIEGSFRSALFPGKDGHVIICAESGSTRVKATYFCNIAYIHVSDNPYRAMEEAFLAVRVHLNTFKLLEEKSVPDIVDKFGWCTWDAFYLTVEPAGVWQGVHEFEEAGVPLRFIIIDDGWQSVNFDNQKDPTEDAKNLILGGSQVTARLHRLDECAKFRNYEGGSLLAPNSHQFDSQKPKLLISKALEVEKAEKARRDIMKASSKVKNLDQFAVQIESLKRELEEIFINEKEREEQQWKGRGKSNDEKGMKAFTRDLRSRFKGLEDIYVWQALCGAWGGVRPGTSHLNSKVIPCKVSPGLDGTMNDLAVVKLLEGGIGLVHPHQAHELFESMHSYLAQVGITGVKVDVLHTLELVCEEYGGRVELAKAYYKGLSRSLEKNFKGSGLISSMQQCNDFFFLGTEQISMGRVGDDFWCQDPQGDPMGAYWLQGVHMIHCAYNSLWMGHIIKPDWDMFQSGHPCAKFHAGSRAICGGPIYVSDSLGDHDFGLLKQLIFPDGSIPKCQHFALPTRDCLFVNPLFDNNSLLKIWNFNKYGGVVGAFNCQGAGWDPKEQRIKSYPQSYKPTFGHVHVNDIEWEATTHHGEYAVYLSQAQKLLKAQESDGFGITLDPSSFEIFTFAPLMKLGSATKFGPIGLTSMFNSGGSILSLDFTETTRVRMEIKGRGTALFFSSGKPRKCFLNSCEVGFEWSVEGRLTMDVPWIEDRGGVSELVFLF